MEPEPEDEEQAAAAAATDEAPDESTVAAARVSIAGHEIAVDSTALDVSGWGLTAAQVREVAGALPQLLCLRELVLDGLPVSGATPKHGGFRYGVESVDADLGIFRVLCEVLRACQALTSLSLKKCYLGPQALAVLAEVVFRDASAVLTDVNMSGNPLTGKMDDYGRPVDGKDISGVSALFPVMTRVINLNVSECGLGPTSVPELAKLVRDARAVIAKVSLAGNMIASTGKEYDDDLFGLISLCEVLPTLHAPISLDLSNCYLRVKGVNEVAKAMAAGAVLAHLAICQNKFGSEGGTALVEAIKTSNLESISIGKNLVLPIKSELDSPTLDASNQDIDPGYVMILAWWLSTPARAAVLTEVNASGNPLTGGKVYSDIKRVTDGQDISGVSVLFPVMTQVVTLNVSNCGLGPTAMPELSKLVRDARAALKSLTVDSTGVMGDQKAYTLTVGEATIDSSQKNLGPADITLLSEWMKRPEVSAVLKKVALRGNPLTGGEPKYLSLSDGKYAQTDGKDTSGVSVLFPSMTQVTELDVSDSGLGPTSMPELVKLVSDARAAIAHVALSGNMITGSTRVGYWDAKFDLDMSGIIALGQAVVVSKTLTAIDVSACGISVAGITEVAKFISAGAVLTEVNASGNPLTGGLVYSRGTVDKGDDISGVSILFPAMTKVITLNISNCGLGPSAMPELSKLVRDASAVLTDVNMSVNPLTGKMDDYGCPVDGKDISGVSTLFPVMTRVINLNVSLCGLGPTSMPELAKLVRDATAALAVVTCDSTGDPNCRNGGPFSYTLNVQDTSLDLSSKNFGPADVTLLAVWIQRPEVSAALRVLTCNSTGGYTKSYTLRAQRGVHAECIDMGYSVEDAALLRAWAQCAWDSNEPARGLTALSALCDYTRSGPDAQLDFGIAHFDAVSGYMLPLLCDPTMESMHTIAMELVAAACVASSVIENLTEKVGLIERIVELVAEGSGATQGHAAAALGHACKNRLVSERVAVAVRQSSNGRELLAVLASSTEPSLAALATMVLQQVGVSKTQMISELRTDGFSLMYAARRERGWRLPSDQDEYGGLPWGNPKLAAKATWGVIKVGLFDVETGTHVCYGGRWGVVTRHEDTEIVLGNTHTVQWHDDRSISELKAKQFDATVSWSGDPAEFVEHCTRQRVFVEQHGEGTVVAYLKSQVGADAHLINFDIGGVQKVKLRRHHNGRAKWLLPPEPSSMPIWQMRDADASVVTKYPRTAKSDDVCMWLYESGGVCRFYAGLFGWVQMADSGVRKGVNGAHLVAFTDESMLSSLGITAASHRAELLRTIEPLCGFLRRYTVDGGPPIHRSATAVAIAGRDEALAGNGEIVLKRMRHRAQFEAEIANRFVAGTRLSACAVVQVVAWHTPAGEQLTDGSGQAQEPECTEPGDDYPYVLVMTQGERSLYDACGKERLAGYDVAKVLYAARSIVSCVGELHDRGVVHGDLKPRNILRMPDGNWILCDMDASARVGDQIGQKTSPAYAPPELAIVRFGRGGDDIVAHASFDIWSLGVVFFELFAGRTLFSQDINNDDLVDHLDCRRLCVWNTASDDELQPIFQAPGTTQAKDNAMNLVRWCLQGDPAKRPAVADILQHPLLSPGHVAPHVPMRYHGFMSHAQADASGTVGTLYLSYRQYGLYNWLDMRQEVLTLSGMRQGVRDSEVFLLILTEHVLSSWFCQQECLCAIEEQKPVQLIIEVEPRFHPFDLRGWSSSSGHKPRTFLCDGQSTELTVSIDTSNAWQVRLGEEELAVQLSSMIDRNLSDAITYRRRDYEAEAMMQELCSRNGLVLPTWVPHVDDEPEPEPEMVSTHDQKLTRVFLIHSSRAAQSEMVMEAIAAIEQQDDMVITTALTQANRVLLLLTEGVLRAASLQLLVETIRADNSAHCDRIIAIYDASAGWTFGCAEQRAAPPEVQTCINDHEAIVYRPKEETGPSRHEFPCMMQHLLSKLHVGNISTIQNPDERDRRLRVPDKVLTTEVMALKEREIRCLQNTHRQALAATQARLEILELELAKATQCLVANQVENARLQELLCSKQDIPDDLINASHAAAPPGWTTAISRSTGELYYINELTGESTWECPVAATPTSRPRYVCRARAIVRSGIERSTEHVGVLDIGEVITALDEVHDSKGTIRVRFERGWTSKVTADGHVVLQDVSLPIGWSTEVSRSSGEMHCVNEESGQSSFDFPAACHGDQYANTVLMEENVAALAVENGALALQAAAKDKEVEQALAAKDELLAAKEAELQALAARLAAFEGVPPE